MASDRSNEDRQAWPLRTLREANVTLIDCDHRTPPAQEDGYPYVTIPQLKNGRIDLSSSRRISPEHYIEWTRKAKPSAFDVVLSRRCNPGETAVVQPGMEFALGQNLVLLRADGSEIHPPFLRWLVRGPEWWDQIKTFLNVGAVFDSLKCADIPKFTLCIPPVGDQKTIADFLGALDARIEALQLENALMEQIAQTIFKSWFVDFDPVRVKADGRDPEGMDAETAALFPSQFDESKFGPIPLGWKVTALGDELSVIETGSRPKGGVKDVSEGIPSVGAESIVGIGKFDYGKTKFVPCDYFAAMRKGHVADGDVLLYKDGGRPGIFIPHVTMVGSGFPFQTFCINEHVYRLRVKPPIPQPYLYFWLCSDFATAEMKNRGTGVAIPGLNSTAVKELTFLLPAEEIMTRFADIVNPLVQKLFENCNIMRTLSVVLDTLLPRLVSGKLRVSEADRMVEAVV